MSLSLAEWDGTKDEGGEEKLIGFRGKGFFLSPSPPRLLFLGPVQCRGHDAIRQCLAILS